MWWQGRKEKGQIPASDTFKDEHGDVEHLIGTGNVGRVDSALRCVRSFPTETNTRTWGDYPWNKTKKRGAEKLVGESTVSNWSGGGAQLQSQALKSLKKAAPAAVTPLLHPPPPPPHRIQPSACQVTDIRKPKAPPRGFALVVSVLSILVPRPKSRKPIARQTSHPPTPASDSLPPSACDWKTMQSKRKIGQDQTAGEGS